MFYITLSCVRYAIHAANQLPEGVGGTDWSMHLHLHFHQKPCDDDQANKMKTKKLSLLEYCTSNGTQFFVFKILHLSYFIPKVCMRIEIAKS